MNPQVLGAKFIAVGVTILVIFSAIYLQYREIKSLESELDKQKSLTVQYSDALDYQNQAIINNEQNQTKAQELPKVITKIQTKYQTVYSTIEKWRESNATDCNSSMHFIDAYPF